MTKKLPEFFVYTSKTHLMFQIASGAHYTVYYNTFIPFNNLCKAQELIGLHNNFDSSNFNDDIN